MHRIDGDAQYPAGHFSEGDPLVPRLPTQVTAAWLDNVQEELAGLVTTAGLALIKGTAQLQSVIANLGTTQTFTAVKTFAAGLAASAASSITNNSATPALTLTNTGGYALSVTAGHIAGVTLTMSSTVAALRGIFTGSATTAPLNTGIASALPSSPVTGDTFFMFDTGVTYLYHCDSAPSSWSRVAMTRLY